MATRILVPFDGSPPARRGLEYALETFPDAEITVLTVIDELPAVPEYFASEASGHLFVAAEKRLAVAESIADEYDASVDCVLDVGPTCRTITEYAETADIDHVVMGTHGRTGLSRIVVGSVAETIARKSSAPVTTVR